LAFGNQLKGGKFDNKSSNQRGWILPLLKTKLWLCKVEKIIEYFKKNHRKTHSLLPMASQWKRRSQSAQSHFLPMLCKM
jgi:hypothetical protein